MYCRRLKKAWEATQQAPRSEEKEREEALQALEQRFPYSPWKDHRGAGISLQLVTRTTPGLSWRAAACKESTQEQGKPWGGRSWYGLAITPLFPSPCTTYGKRQGRWEWRTEVEPRKKLSLGVWGQFFTIQIYSNCQETKFPRVESVLPVLVPGKRSPCLYLNPLSFPSDVPRVLLKRGSESTAGWASGSQPRSSQHSSTEVLKIDASKGWNFPLWARTVR